MRSAISSSSSGLRGARSPVYRFWLYWLPWSIPISIWEFSVSWTFRTPIIDFPFDELLKTCWVFSFFRRRQCLWWPEVEDLLYTVHYFGTRGLSTKGWERYSRGEIMEELSDKTFWKSRIILTFPPQLPPSSLLLLIFLGTEIETNFELERMTNSLYKVITTPLLWKCWNWEFFNIAR